MQKRIFNLTHSGTLSIISLGLEGGRFESGDVLISFSPFSHPIESDPFEVLLLITLLLSVAPPPDLEAPLELSILSLALAEFDSREREEDRDMAFILSAPMFEVTFAMLPKLFDDDFFISCFFGVSIGLKYSVSSTLAGAFGLLLSLLVIL
jgi:hypothetical protein